MILLQQESYERSIILGASCKHVCSNVTLLIWQQTNNRLTTFTLVMGINAGKRIWGSEGGASYEHKGYEFDWLPVYPFPINTFFTAVSIMVGHNMGGAVLLYWSWGLLLGGDWRLSDPVGVRYFRKFGGKWLKDIFAMSAEHKSKRVWCLVFIRSNIESVGHRKCAGCWGQPLWLMACCLFVANTPFIPE